MISRLWANPLPEPLLIYHQLCPQGENFIHEYAFENHACIIGAIFVPVLNRVSIDYF